MHVETREGSTCTTWCGDKVGGTAPFLAVLPFGYELRILVGLASFCRDPGDLRAGQDGSSTLQLGKVW